MFYFLRFFLSFSMILLAKSAYSSNIAFSPQVSVGYSLNHCYTNEGQITVNCSPSTKYHLGLNLGAKNVAEEVPPDIAKNSDRDQSNYHLYNFWNLKFDKWEDFVIIAAFIVVVFFLYGIIAAVLGVYHSDLTFGFFYSRDVANSKNIDQNDSFHLNYVDKFGINFGLYFGYSTNFLMKLSTAYAKANLNNHVMLDQNESLDGEGLSSSLAFGWIPRLKDSGLHAYYELEGGFYQGGSFIERTKQNLNKENYNLKQISHSLVVGYSF